MFPVYHDLSPAHVGSCKTFARPQARISGGIRVCPRCGGYPTRCENLEAHNFWNSIQMYTVYIYIHFHFWECSAVDRHGWQRDFCGRKTQRFYRVLHFCDRQITHYILSTDSAAFKCFTFASFSVSFHTVESVVRIKPIAPNTATFHISHTLAAVWDQQRQSDGLRCFCLEAQRSWIIHQKRMGQNWVSKKWDVERKWFGQALSGHTVPQVLAGGFRKKKNI